MARRPRISEAEHQWRSCTRKIRYEDYGSAQARVDEEYRESGLVLKRYPCRFCLGWHVGTPMTGQLVRQARRRLEKARRKTLWKGMGGEEGGMAVGEG